MSDQPKRVGETSRRDFVRTSSFAAAALAFAPSLLLKSGWKPSPAKPLFQLGLASYTFRNFTRAQLIGFMKQLDVVELNAKDVKDHLPASAPEEAAAVADYAAAGIHLHAAGAIYFSKDEDADVRAKFEYCKRAGIGVIVAGDPAPETLLRIERFVKEYDIRIAIHNHGPEDKLWASPLSVLAAVEKLDPRVGCCIDVGHTTRAGVDPIQAIRAVGTRLFNVHMKDLLDPKDKESQVAVGDGVLPIQKMFEALTEVNYRGFVDLEYEVHPEDPIPGVSKSFGYMRQVLARMGSSDRTSS